MTIQSVELDFAGAVQCFNRVILDIADIDDVNARFRYKASINTEPVQYDHQRRTRSKSSRATLKRYDYVQKVNEVYNVLAKWNSECQTLPLIVDRLRHCVALSEQSGDLLRNWPDIQKTLDRFAASIDKMSNDSTTRKFFGELGAIEEQLSKFGR